LAAGRFDGSTCVVVGRNAFGFTLLRISTQFFHGLDDRVPAGCFEIIAALEFFGDFRRSINRIGFLMDLCH
jgi:hypothetical protein